MADVREQLQRIKQENSGLEKELHSNTNAKRKVGLLEVKVAENTDTIEQLRQEHSLLAADHKDLLQCYSKVSETVNRLRSEQAASQTSHDSRQHQLNLRLLEIEDLRRALADQADDLARAESERNRIVAEKGDVARTVAALETDLCRVRKFAEAFGRDLNSARSYSSSYTYGTDESSDKEDSGSYSSGARSVMQDLSTVKTLDSYTYSQSMSSRGDSQPNYGHHPSESSSNCLLAKSPNARSLFINTRARDIGRGLQAWRGFSQSVRPAIGRLLINVDLSNAADHCPSLASFVHLVLHKHVKSMECSGIVFDTAPTGHTLHFLSSPTVLSEKALGKLSILSRRIGPMINQVGAGADTVVEENTHGASDLPIIEFADLDRHHIDHPLPPPARARKPHKIHKRPAPSRALSEPPSAPPVPSSEHEEECLLLMSLSPLRCKSRWDLFFQIGSGGNLLVRHTSNTSRRTLPTFDGSNCEHCRVRHNMQQKYLNEAHELYNEFLHIVQLLLLTEEVHRPLKL
ncbi:ATPase GET3 [Grifola frondosa]|uniref:ATPase GET3 n=1 Tax=Grifola frondosa TaxID=5627 RepID=A0A1C7M1B2_GRIFR|nr:ATPase GET3 [Grifola frondosa]